MHDKHTAENEILVLGILQKRMTKYHLTMVLQVLSKYKNELIHKFILCFTINDYYHIICHLLRNTSYNKTKNKLNSHCMEDQSNGH